MAEASKVAFELWYDQIPVLAGTLESVQQSFVPGGTRANRLHVEPNVRYAEHMGDHEQFILNDPQTSGGLLIAVPADKQSVMESALEEAGLLNACIGKVIQFDGAHIRVM
jgi:selenide,water dikinase